MKPAWVVENLPAPPDPDNVPCKGQAALFDLDIYEDPDSQDPTRIRVGGGFTSMADRLLISMAQPALEACAGCPLRNREWCVKTTDVSAGQFTGVAGGILFRNGNPIADIDSVFGVEQAA